MTAPDTQAPATIERPLLVGRVTQLARFERVLESRAPALVLVSGASGMGKSSFLRAIQIQAAERGWSSAGEPLSINAGTDEKTLEGNLRKALDTARDGLDNTPSRGISGGYRESGSREAWGAQRTIAHPILELLRKRAPVLVCIKGYRPSRAFGERFADLIGVQLRRLTLPVVVVVADLPSALTPLSAYATDTIELGELDAEPVRQHLQTLGETLSPPITPKELASYVDAVGKNPGLLGALTRILSLDRADASAAGVSS